MTWKELKTKIDTMNELELSKEVPIFHFANGEMDLLNECEKAPGKYGSHCEDIKDFKNQYYLLCGLNI